MASVQSRLESVQTDDELDPTHIQVPEHMNKISDDPIIGQTLEQFTVAKESNCKDSSRPEQELRRMHLPRDMLAPGARISRARDARAQVMPRRAYDVRRPSG